MKAVSFFCVVFLSMLVVFLVATGEVSRWFSGGSSVAPAAVRTAEPVYETTVEGNHLSFPYWDPNLARLVFTIRAELEQEDLRVESNVEKLRELALKNGQIEVPIYADMDLASSLARSETEPSAGAESFLLEFASALWRRSGANENRFWLREGRGRGGEGTELRFEELVFDGATVEDDRYLLRSEKPVSIRNEMLQVQSSSGLTGVLRGSGLESIRFEPPVAAVFDAASVTSPAADGSSGDGDRAPTGEGAPAVKSSRLAVISQGPLELRFIAGDRTAEPPEPSVTTIRFAEDVVLFPVGADADASSLTTPEGNRFECQELVIELARGAERRLHPRRAYATWEDGRVRATFTRAGEEYVLDGDRLEWNLPPGALGSAADAPERGPRAFAGLREAVLAGEAVLVGKPTLRKASGGDELFVAERATLRLGSDRLVFEEVSGTMDFSTIAARRPSRESGRAAGIEGNGRRPVRGPVRGRDGDEEEAVTTVSLPPLWDMRADRLEFLFAALEKGGPRELSGLIAVSESPAGVEIRSRPVAGDDAPPIVVKANELRYLEAEKRMRLTGDDGSRPRLTRGEDWIEATEVQLRLADGIARFEGTVRGRFAPPPELLERASADADGATEPETEADTARAAAAGDERVAADASPADGAADASGAESIPDAFALESEWLEIGVVTATNELSFARARSAGHDDLVVLRSLSEPEIVLTGRDLRWLHGEGIAELHGALPEDLEAAGPSRFPVRAELRVRGGELLAQTVRFEHGSFRATLLEQVTVRSYQGSREPDGDSGAPPQIEIDTARAEIEFFEDFAEGPLDAGPSTFPELRRIKTLQAERGAEPIVVRHAAFVGRADEVRWEWATRELRFYGPRQDRQEIEILQDDFSGPLRAEEIVYNEATNVLVLHGGVTGEFLQAPRGEPEGDEVRDARLAPSSTRRLAASGPLLWRFETDVLEARLRPQTGRSSALELVSVSARDKVLLRNDAEGLQLRGDALDYDEASRTLRLSSPDGRMQTLLHAKTIPGAEGKPAREVSDKIMAQEVWVEYHEDRQTGSSGKPRRRVQVEFEGDVIATFVHGEEPVEGAGDAWKMLSQKLTLHVDPERSSEGTKAIPWATASGNVSFHSGKYEAGAERAIYEEALQRLTLLGSAGSPARLYRDKRVIQEHQRIVLQRDGDDLTYESGR